MGICVFGNIVDFIYCLSDEKIIEGKSQRVSSIVCTIGNDAAIVAFVLAKLKQKLQFIPIATSSSKRLCMMKDAGISVIDSQATGTDGTTVLLEDGYGNRTFLSSPISFIKHFSIPETALFSYFDFYEEHQSFLEHFLEKASAQKRTQLYLNLSSSNIIEKATFLANFPKQPDFIQFSCEEEVCGKMLAAIRSRLEKCILIATCGSHGSCISVNGETYSCRVDQPDERNIMGAGAFFAAYFICAFCDCGDPVDAHRYAFQRVSDLCRGSGNILLESLPKVQER